MQRKWLCVPLLHDSRVQAVFVISAWVGRRTACVHRGGLNVCVFGVGLVATLKKDMHMCVSVSGMSVTYTYMHTLFHPAMSGIKIAFHLLYLQYMMHIIPILMCDFIAVFVSQLQKTGVEMASRQEPRQQGRGREKVQRAVRGV